MRQQLVSLSRFRSAGLALLVGVTFGCASTPRDTVRESPPPPAPIPSERPARPSDTGERRAEVVRLARAQLGKPYALGAVGPDRFDCSGLVQRVYRQVGVSLPRTTTAQARVGRVLARDELRAGDLVLFGDNSGVSHVGIWIGDGRFVHASSSRGVVVDTLAVKWFRDRLLSGRRVLTQARP